MKNSETRKAVFPGKYIQGENTLSELTELINFFGSNALILASPTAKNKILPKYDITDSENRILIDEFQGECCEKELERLVKIIRLKRINIVVGMGGGKAIDAAKIASDRTGLPVIIVPTIASTDAPCSGCAVIYTEEGTFDSVYYQKMNPQAVLIDMNVIAESPVRYLVSGMGDALATWFEARSCDRTRSPNACGGYSTLAGLNLAKLCYDTLLLYGPAAKIANENKVVTPALNHIVEANILLSGIGFESSGLATAHSVHNGLTALKETHPFYHGEKVAFGVVTGLHLTDASPAEIEEVYTFSETVGLPTTFADIGLNSVNNELLMQVATKACAPEEGIHHEAGEITPQKVLQAMIVADRYGSQRKQRRSTS